jgi:hypothetical protein
VRLSIARGREPSKAYPYRTAMTPANLRSTDHATVLALPSDRLEVREHRPNSATLQGAYFVRADGLEALPQLRYRRIAVKASLMS